LTPDRATNATTTLLIAMFNVCIRVNLRIAVNDKFSVQWYTAARGGFTCDAIVSHSSIVVGS